MIRTIPLKINEIEHELQQVERLISQLHQEHLKSTYLQEIASMRKDMLHSLLLYYDVRIPTDTFTLADLKQNYDGKNNQPAYIAIDGIVYDITYEAAWAGGSHFGIQAGEDVSDALNSCHSQNKEEIINQLVPVGTLEG